MLREPLRSTLYSSSRPFSSSATRRSSFSTLTTILLPVLGEPRPKIFLTLSNINFIRLRDLKRMMSCEGNIHRSLDRHWLLETTAYGSWRGLRRRPFPSKKPFKKVGLSRWRSRRSADHPRTLGNLSLCVGLLLHIGRCVVTGHLHVRARSGSRGFFIVAATNIRIFERYRLDQLERIWV